MQRANILLSLGGDSGNTVPKFGVTAAEVAVLRAIHGDDAVNDIVITDEVTVSNKAELHRLKQIYGGAKDSEQKAYVDILYPGAAARVFETFEELELSDVQYKTAPAPAAAPAAEVAPKAAKAPKATKAAKGPKAAEIADAAADEGDDEGDGIGDMKDDVAKTAKKKEQLFA